MVGNFEATYGIRVGPVYFPFAGAPVFRMTIGALDVIKLIRSPSRPDYIGHGRVFQRDLYFKAQRRSVSFNRGKVFLGLG